MKILHCADIHLDSKMSSVFEAPRARERRNEILHRFCEMVEYGYKRGVEVVLICGDLFDTSNVSSLTMSTVTKCIEAHPEMLFFYIRGNHDEDAFLSVREDRPDNFFSFGENWTEYSLGESDRVHLYGVEINGLNNTSLLESFSAEDEFINLVMLHGQAGADIATDSEALDLRLLRGKSVDYLALGHVHAYGRERLDERGIYSYCGCLEPRGFDEPGEHGFVILDIDEEAKSIRDEFIPFATRRMWEIPVDVTDTGDTADIIACMREVLSDSSFSAGDLVKVSLEGSFNVEGEIDINYISTVFKGDFYAFRVENHTKPYIDYDKYAGDESLKGEFVRLCMQENLDDRARGEILHLGLTAIFGGDLK